MKHYLISAAIGLVLSGCSATSPAIHEYTLLPELATVQNSVPLSVKTLAVMPIKAIPSLSLKHVVYVQPNGETGPYLYARWSDTPANMIGKQISLTLEEKNIFASLIPAASSAKPDWLLESNLHAFYHRFQNETESEGVVDITFRVVDANDKRIVATKRFTIITDAKTPDSKGGIDALSSATRQLSDQSSQWLSKIAKECP